MGGGSGQRTFLMCPPRHFGVDTARNPWLASRWVARRELGARQWARLRDLLVERLGARVLTIEPEEGLPGMVFTANAGLVSGGDVIPSRFRDPRRHGEALHFERWFEAHGYRVHRLPSELRFEGQGEIRWLGDHLVAGYHFPQDLAVHRFVEDRLGVSVLSLPLADRRFYHLDTCLLPLSRDAIAFCPAAFEPGARELLTASFERCIEIGADDAVRFAANSIVSDGRALIPTGCAGLRARLEHEGLGVLEVDVTQFRLEGGGVKCLVLDLDEGAGRGREAGAVAP